jgi:hypothetical protein
LNRQNEHHNYDALGLNITHAYINTAEPGSWQGDPNRHTPSGWVDTNDHLYSNVPVAAITWALGDMYTHNESRFMWMRPKIEWLCFGQSSIYKAYQDNSDLWFYGFNEVIGEPFQDFQWNDGKTVLHCGMPTGGSNAQLVLYHLKANTEQCRKDETSTSNQWQGDNECTWYIKPRIRIDSNFAHNNPTTPVCKIKVIAQDETELKSVDIRAINFLDENGYYNGRYLEEYFSHPSNIIDLTVDGAWGDKWCYEARGNRSESQISNHADVQVYWYDNCDMWIDYVKVENDVANDLLSNNPLNPKWVLYNQWITDEVAAAYDPQASEQKVYNFYIELFEFNNIPCMAYVNQKIKQYSGNKIGLMADQLTFFRYHVPLENVAQLFDASYIVRTYINKVGATQVFGGHYPFTAEYPAASSFSRIPNTLQRHQGDDILAQAVSPEDYDAWLQMLLDTACSNVGEVPGDKPNYPPNPMPPCYGYYMATMKVCNKISKEANIPFNAWGQAHQWVMINPDGETEREPTAEESDLLANIPVSYGAKGIIYFAWNSWGTPPNQNYTYGLTTGEDIFHVTPRQNNVYGQPKWAKYQQIIQRLKIWEPYTMSFDNKETNSYIYRFENERNALKNPSKSYFMNVITYRYSNGPQPNCFDNPPVISGKVFECQEDTYVQVATFKQNALVAEPNAKFFMIVNKRCSPYKNNSSEENIGGKRYIVLQFYADHPEFANYNSWDIIDLEHPLSPPIQFNKSCPSGIVLGDFDPGQGRLYEILPSIQHGGNLICDENITGQVFTCLDTVYNNGHNITIGSGTSIHFTDSSKIIMNEGTFQLGGPNNNGPCNISIGAASGNHWRGFDFNNCTVKV